MMVRKHSAAVVAVLAALGIPTPAQAATNPMPGDGRIVDGKVTESAPWAAQFYRGDGSASGPSCSASIIAVDWVLVADHCLTYGHTGKVFSVKVGSLKRGEGTLYQVERYLSKYDVTLLKLATPIQNPVIAPVADAVPTNGSEVEIYGWGKTCPVSQQCPPSPVLKQATLRIDGAAKDHKGGPALQLTHVTGNASNGDSGGPAWFGGKVVGVASTAGTRNAQYSSIAVAGTRQWIRSNAGV
ncbi:serine protease [Pilimelia terevasa]|uniref:Serine protease n=1 Tax=Pilimelia terevasa TaxID=53372 RepID=A0A8J3BTL1_9ACTN|nr:trypsin-like serine protease [Pilimelia terevasa]GGK39124.1 serine protease [Pilimelia terevasa]